MFSSIVRRLLFLIVSCLLSSCLLLWERAASSEVDLVSQIFTDQFSIYELLFQVSSLSLHDVFRLYQASPLALGFKLQARFCGRLSDGYLINGEESF